MTDENLGRERDSHKTKEEEQKGSSSDIGLAAIGGGILAASLGLGIIGAIVGAVVSMKIASEVNDD